MEIDTMTQNTSTNLAVHISKHGEPFKDDKQLLQWITACLNCNVNNASVAVQKLNVPGMVSTALHKVNQAFDNLNTLLDHSGALESEHLQRAVYKLRLEIARGMGDDQRASLAEQSLREIQPSAESIKHFLGLLSQASRVIVNDSPELMASSWSLAAQSGEPANELISFFWTQDDSAHGKLACSVKLTEQGVAEGRWVDDDFYCLDHEGEEVQISLYRIHKLSDHLQAGLTKASDEEDSGPPEVLPGATQQEIQHLDMQDVVGAYDTPQQVPEWAWVEQHACYEHVRNGQDGVWEFVLNLSCALPGVPDKLAPVIADARKVGMAYLIVHQGT